MVSKVFTQFNRQLIRPRSNNPDDQRREYIFNVLIALFTFAAAAATASSGITHLLAANAHKTNSVPITFAFLVLTACLWWLSRRGHYTFAAYVLTTLVLLAGLELTATWSIELPMAQLLNVLVIIVAGLVISSRAALLVTALISISTVVLAYMQVEAIISVNTSWLTKRLELSDAVGLVVIYCIVGAVSWLANNEIDSLLQRAWRSEKALAKERDQLEVTVAERTRELEQAQRSRTLELQHFAEFGRVSANLVHDLASPLTAASLNLEQAGDQASSNLVTEAMASLRHIETYIASARKQLQGSSQHIRFSARKEATEVISLLQHHALSANVKIELTSTNRSFIIGDPVAFHRVLANLVINAIDSYARRRTSDNRSILVTILKQPDQLVVVVQDFGIGIKATDLPHIFEDFYSTKKQIGRGLGLGLANAKRIIEQDFGGSITVTSTPKQGTTFTIGIPLHDRSSTTKHSKRPNLPRG